MTTEINMTSIGLLFLFLGLRIISAENTCVNRHAVCVNIRDCPSLIEISRGPRPLSQETLEALKNAQCGFEGSEPMVCCINQQPSPAADPSKLHTNSPSDVTYFTSSTPYLNTAESKPDVKKEVAMLKPTADDTPSPTLHIWTNCTRLSNTTSSKDWQHDDGKDQTKVTESTPVKEENDKTESDIGDISISKFSDVINTTLSQNNITKTVYDTHQYYNSTFIIDIDICRKYWVDMDNHPELKVNHVLSQGHRRAATVKLKFDFPFYRHKIRNITITTGGFLYTGENSWLAAFQYIAPLMANFDTRLWNASYVKYADNGTAFTVEWEKVMLQDKPEAGAFTFQVTLHQNGDIVFVYSVIPLMVEQIADRMHPVKIGLSDAYIMDKTVFFIRRKTIYEYHRVNFNRQNIMNCTVIYLKALPTCLDIDNCRNWPTKVTKSTPVKEEDDKTESDIGDISISKFSDVTNTTLSQNNITKTVYDIHQYYNSSFIIDIDICRKYWVDMENHPELKVNHVLSRSHRRAATVKLKFDFPFYGHKVRNITIATGGFLYTGEYVHSWQAALQYIAPLMANFDTRLSNASYVKYADNGTAFTVEWEKVMLQDKPEAGAFTFQVTLHQNGDIVFVYSVIPLMVEQIVDRMHPVKIGLSDAYIMDRTVFFIRRKIIYEYHRVNFNRQNIMNCTVIYLKALPTCLDIDNCRDWPTKVTESTPVKEEDDKTESDIGDISISKFSDVTNTTLSQNNITKTVYDIHQYYNSSFIIDIDICRKYWVDMDNHPELKVNHVLSRSHRRAATVKLKFDFPFYGHKVRNITIATGGFLYTGEYVHSWLAALQYIAPLMANFDTRLSNASYVKYADNGTAFTVEWEKVMLQDKPEAGAFTFQVTLHQNGDIVFVYSVIPLMVEQIVDRMHPVKIGLSDAYIMDRTVFFIRRKTIYEYHRVNFNRQNIMNCTVIYLKALPTCLDIDNCRNWPTKVTKSTPVKEEDDKTESDIGDISISKFSDVTNTTLSQNNITKTVYDIHQYYNSSFIIDIDICRKYWVDMDNHPELKVNHVLSRSHRRAATVKLKFDFPFYGHKVRNITIATGGFLYTGEYVHSWLAALQYIAPLMANFDTRLSNASYVKYADNGTAFTVEWEKVMLQDKPEAGAFTFQVTLHQNGDIVFVYSVIPLMVEQIVDRMHPVKIVLSDAYIMDRTVFFIRRKTIYEYHRVNFNRQNIMNCTVIYLKALPTCLDIDNCRDWPTKVTESTPVKEEDDKTESDIGDISISKFSDVTNTTLSQNNITKTVYDIHQYYNSSFIIDIDICRKYWVDMDNHPELKVNHVLSRSHRRAATVKLKFDFPFYGHKVRNITIATGGFLYTGEYVHSWLAALQYIAPLMANFDTRLSNASYVKYADNGTAFTVEWEKVMLQDKPEAGAFTFQVTLHQNGDIVFVYSVIPLMVEQIVDRMHPVKIGLSDAYIMDRTVFFIRRKTIYEYHRVNFNRQNIMNCTVIYLKALPTCLDIDNCRNWPTKVTKSTPVKEEDDKTESDIGDISISKFSDVTNTTLSQNNITKTVYDIHQYYNSSFIIDIDICRKYWVDMDNHPELKVNHVLSRSHRRAATVKLKFDFPFYGHKVRNITIATGGFLYTGEYVHSWLAALQYIAPLMANFDTRLSNASYVKYADNGTAFTVEWEKVMLQDKPEAGAFTFQVTLHQNGDIVFVYSVIPLMVEQIVDRMHPVKIGLSDAYIMDRTVFFIRRKTIYEYHRVNFNRQNIMNCTVIYLKALPTCLDIDNCRNWPTKVTKSTPVKEEDDKTESDIGDISISKFSDVTNTTLSQNNITKTVYDIHQYYNSSFIIDIDICRKYWVDMDNHPELKVNHVLSRSHRRAATVKLKFDFPFYGHKVRNITIATGGFLYTGEYVHSWLAALQYIAPLMANFDTRLSNASYVKYADNGTAFTVEWEKVMLQDKPEAGAFTFQVTLHQNGDIVFVYSVIPLMVEQIVDRMHPVKIGLSDAYIMDRTVFFIRRKTIYEYHRVNFNRQNIMNCTVIYLKALPTCLDIDNCRNWPTKVTKSTPVKEEDDKTESDIGDISISKFSDVTNTTLSQNNITKTVYDIHQYYNSSFIIDIDICRKYWVDMDNHPELKVNHVLSRSHRRAATVKLKFDFPFYGHKVRNITIAIGGFLYTGEYVHSWLAALQYIAPLMANFDTRLSNASYVKYADNGTAFTVEWEKVMLQDKPEAGAFTFQVTLHQNGDIVFVYSVIPLMVEQIVDRMHPVKIGLSDAYIMDRTVFFIRRKTIYEYHRVNFNRQNIMNCTVIYLKALPTCLDIDNCRNWPTKVTKSTPVKEEDDKTESDIGDISISKFSDVTNTTLSQNNITKTVYDIHQYYNSSFIIDIDICRKYWVDMDNHPELKVNHVLSRSHRRAATVKLKFDFPFYGHKVRNITIATGGFLYTGEYVHSWLAALQYIAPLMANFDTRLSNASYVKYADNGTAFTVEWEKVMLQDKPEAGAFTFQVTLHQNGDIVFVYSVIPLMVEQIVDRMHPVKIGLSDAYIMDRTVFFIRRKTIYEYHRVNFNRQNIMNCTVIYLKALPTCLDIDNCRNWPTKVTKSTPVKEEDDKTESDIGDISISKFSDVTNTTLSQNNITKTVYDIHQYYNSSFIIDIDICRKYWVDMDNHPELKVNHVLSRSHRRAATVKLKFDFPFYGHKVRNITIAIGGFLYTGEYVHSWLAAFQYIAPLMANFDTRLSNASYVKYADNGTAFTVEWEKVMLQDKPEAGAFTFQVTLHQNGDIVFVYSVIPLIVEQIVDRMHPVKIGLSDAYIMDRTVFFIRRKTIYEYHRVNFNRQNIMNCTVIYLKALPTCLDINNCHDCLTKVHEFNCKWCPELNQCTSIFRSRQDWRGCDMRYIEESANCPSHAKTYKGEEYDHDGHATEEVYK